MNWRIENIEIQNFKFFHEKFTFSPHRKNILLYGENGSGKSSIYWSLNKLLQVSAQDKEEATKSFTSGYADNLRNRFASKDMSSYIKAIFSDENGESKTIVVSDKNYYSEGQDLHTFLNFTSTCSDFLNYKFLYSIFDFSDEEENDIFEIFEKEFMQYLNFSKFLDAPQNLSSNNALQCWSLIKDAFSKLPFKTSNNEIGINPSKNELPIEFEKFLLDFNDAFALTLQLLALRINSILLNDLNIKERINFNYTAPEFFIKTENSKIEYIFKKPKISISIKMNHPNLEDNSPIIHPRAFFNEAKLTCIALAIRFAILEKHPQLQNCTSLLIIDDLLISLDMGIRSKVIPVLLSYAERFQMFIFTHDRLLYRHIKDELRSSGKLNQWETNELFLEEEPFPKPVMRIDNDYLGEAKYQLSKHFYAAAANAARRGLEKILKRIIPENKKYSVGINGELRETTLKEMTDYFLNACEKLGIEGFKNLRRHSEMILNPLSHDDIRGPVFARKSKRSFRI